MAGRKRVELSGSGPGIEFARQLRELRDLRGMTLRELAGKSGYSTASLSSAERGVRLPSWDLVAAFVQSCGDDAVSWRPRWELAGMPVSPAASDEGSAPPVGDSLTTAELAPIVRAAPRRRTALMLAALAGIGIGVGAGLPWALASHGSAGPRTTLVPSWDTYGCVGSDAPRTVLLDPPGDARLAGWQSSRPVPWRAPQCQGQIWWAPYLNGGANPAVRFSWTFAAPSGGAAACALWAYYPPPPAGHLGGTAHYLIQDGTDAAARRMAYLAVAQADYKGTWHALGAFDITSGFIKVTLDNSGTDEVAEQGAVAGPIHVSCH